MNRIYIVTGALGHLGNTSVHMLSEAGENVRCLAMPGDRCPSLDDLNVSIFRGDVCDLASLEDIFAVPEAYDVRVIHAAGIVSIASKFNQKVWDVNVGGTANIIQMCKKTGVQKLVYVSSVHALQEASGVMREASCFVPDSLVGLYAQTKAEAANLVIDAAREGLDASVVHPSGIIGPYDFGHGHLTQLVKDYMDGRLGAGVRGGYDFVDVRDVAAGILAACEKGRSGECYILSGKFHTVPELLDTLHVITGKRKIRLYLPMWLAKLTAPLAELYYKLRRQPPLFTPYSLYTLSGNALFSHEKATKELGYAPRTLEESLRDTVKWLDMHGMFKAPRRRRAKKRVNA